MMKTFKVAAIVAAFFAAFALLGVLSDLTNRQLAQRCAEVNGVFAQAPLPLASTCTVQVPTRTTAR